MNLLLSIAFGLALTSSISEASIPCLKHVSKGTFAVSFKEDVKGPAKEKLNQVITETLTELESILPPNLGLPSNMRVVVSSHFRDEYRVLDTAVTLELQDAKKTASTLVHESGHAIIEESIESHLSSRTKILHQTWLNLSLQQRKLELQMQKDAAAGTLNYKVVNAEITKIVNLLENQPDMQTIFLTFQEFFADSLTFIFTDNPNANVYKGKSPEEDAEILLSRSFSIESLPENFEAWKAGLAKNKAWATSRHYAFAPSRWHLGSILNGKIKTKEDKTRVIHAVHLATAQAFSKFLETLLTAFEKEKQKDPDADFYRLLLKADIVELNNLLIQFLDKNLG